MPLTTLCNTWGGGLRPPGGLVKVAVSFELVYDIDDD